jgi:hypothetical protein
MKMSFCYTPWRRKPELDELGKKLMASFERIKMDTAALKTAFGIFSTDFSTFASDLAKYVSANVPQDTPQQVADVKAVVDGLTGFDQQVKALDALVNPPPAPVVVP